MSHKVVSLLGRLGQERGLRNEQRVVNAFSDLCSKPPWFAKIEKSEKELDRKGIDVVVYTDDVGKLFLQVKSSRQGKEKFISKYFRKPIGIVVINHLDSDDTIRRKVLHELNKLRLLFLEKRGSI